MIFVRIIDPSLLGIRPSVIIRRFNGFERKAFLSSASREERVRVLSGITLTEVG